MSQKVLYDVNPGCDDSTMIFMGLGSSEVEAADMTTVFGNVPLEYTIKNPLTVLEFAERRDIPIATGCERPFVGDANVPNEPDDVDAIYRALIRPANMSKS